jgi:hypothetical protein
MQSLQNCPCRISARDRARTQKQFTVSHTTGAAASCAALPLLRKFFYYIRYHIFTKRKSRFFSQRRALPPHAAHCAASLAVFHKRGVPWWKTKSAASARCLGAAQPASFLKNGSAAAFFTRRDEKFKVLVFTFSSQLCNQIHEKTGYTGFTRKRSRNRLLAT